MQAHTHNQKKILCKNLNGFRKHNFSDFVNLFNLRRSTRQKTQVNPLVSRFHRGMLVQILLTYGLLKETVTAVMILYKKTKKQKKKTNKKQKLKQNKTKK